MEKLNVKIDWSNYELTGLNNDFFVDNRRRFLENITLRLPIMNMNSVLILRGGEDIPRYDTDINYYYFFQESNFYYLTGVRESGLYAAFDFATGKSVLFYDQPPEDNKIWMSVMSSEEMSKKYNIEVFPKHLINDWLNTRNMDVIYVLEGNNEYSGLSVITAELNFEGDLAYLQEKVNHDAKIYEVLCDTRGVKSEKERELLKYIGDITNKAHLEIMKFITPGCYERDLENVFMNYLGDNYYLRIWAYPFIGGCGGNSATLHYDSNDKMISEGDLFLADMGARLCNYTSDVTITIPANGKFTKKQKEIYDIVLKANREVTKSIVPGVTSYSQMDKLSKMIILEELQNLGLIKKEFPVDELYAKSIWRLFMPHGLGHFVGLDVHDVGFKNISWKSQGTLVEGNYVTVEPGIYFIDFVLDTAFNDPEKAKYLNVDLLKTYKGFGGVRIEDDIFISADGPINFQESLPRTTEEIETFMSKHNIYLNKNSK